MIANQLLTFMTNILYDTILSDMETGYKVFRRQVIEGMTLRASRFDFEPEFTAKILKRHYRIYEVPISFNPRDYSQGKKIKLHDADRKSTRLNSSHQLISYAVFCLK